MNYVSLCLIALDENYYLQEWLDYHILIGVERFYIYDNGSRIPLEKTLHEYVTKGLVIVHQITGRAMQLAAYDHCIQTYGKNSRWIGFIDADEFIVLKSKNYLADFLKEYEPYGGLAISSLFFGSNGHISRPPSGQIAHYTKRTPDLYHWNRLVKCIVQPDQVAFPDSPHGFTFSGTSYCVNEDGYRVDNQKFPNHVNKIQLNHYFCRSEEDMQEKLERKLGGAGRQYSRDRFDEVNKYSTVEDDIILNNLTQLLIDHVPGSQELSPNIEGVSLNLAKHIHDVLSKGHNLIESDIQINEVTPRFEFLEYHRMVKKLDTAIQQKDFETSISFTRELLKAFPFKYNLLSSLANLNLHVKNLDAAWKILHEAWVISPNNYEIMTQLSHFFFLVGKYDEAETILRRMLLIGPREVDTHFRLSWALAKQDRMQEAFMVGYPVIIAHGLGGEIFFDNLLELIRLLGMYLKKQGVDDPARNLAKIGLKIAPGDKDFKKWSR